VCEKKNLGETHEKRKKARMGEKKEKDWRGTEKELGMMPLQKIGGGRRGVIHRGKGSGQRGRILGGGIEKKFGTIIRKGRWCVR